MWPFTHGARDGQVPPLHLAEHHHVHSAAPHEDTYWLEVARIYDRARGALQLLSGALLIGSDGADVRDVQREALVAARFSLDEALDIGRKLDANGHAFGLLNELMATALELRGLAELVRPYTRWASDEDVLLRRLEVAANRLRACSRPDRGFDFFGSGGCADVQHKLGHAHI